MIKLLIPHTRIEQDALYQLKALQREGLSVRCQHCPR